jgi:hypothetical protein
MPCHGFPDKPLVVYSLGIGYPRWKFGIKSCLEKGIFHLKYGLRLGVRGMLTQKTDTERVVASVHAVGAQQYLDAKGHKP